MNSLGRIAFAAAMIWLGVLGLLRHDFAPVWEPVAKGVRGREVLVYLTALVSLGSGVGLLWEKTAGLAAKVLLVALVVWMFAFPFRDVVQAPMAVGSYFGCADCAVMIAAAWVLYARFAGEWDRRRMGFVSGAGGVRVGRVLFGLALLLYGLAHLVYVSLTTVLIPAWIPWHTGWAYATGVAFLAASLAVLTGVSARLAAGLAALQIGVFTVVVWVPIVARGGASAFQRSEMVLSAVLTAGAWVVAEGYSRVEAG